MDRPRSSRRQPRALENKALVDWFGLT